MNVFHRTEYPDELTPDAFDVYLDLGWYRMRQYLFTCTHLFDFDEVMELKSLRRVWWIRFRIPEIHMRNSHQRIIRKNKGFRVEVAPYPVIRDGDENLFSRYRASIDFDTYPSLQDALVGENEDWTIFNSWAVSVYDGEKLIALGIFDKGKISASSQLHCYDPEYARCSPGKFLMLMTLQHLMDQGFEWYYPGYVFAGNPKMNYKLFLGTSSAAYYDPDLEGWEAFDEVLLDEEPYSPEFIRELGKQLFRLT